MANHDGHRERLRERFRSEGLDNFTEKQALELMLTYVIPRCDTEPIAGSLMEQFGSLESVLNAPIPALAQIKGIGGQGATFIRLLSEFNRYQMVHRNGSIRQLKTLHDCGEYMRPYFLGRRDEALCVLCLDAQCRILGCKVLSEGSANSAAVSVRKIMEYALTVNATSLIMAHNHPSGVPLPSADDIAVTQKVADALDAVDVLLADHFIYADEEFVSLVESHFFTPTR